MPNFESVKASIFDIKADAIVNPVNCVGVSGKGLAKEFAVRYPDENQLYRAACNKGLITTGTGFAVGRLTRIQEIDNVRFIVYFPTKNHWRNPSKLQYIQDGLADLLTFCEEKKIKSIAMPKLGCGLGGLWFGDVAALIDKFAYDAKAIGVSKVIVCSPD